MPVLADPKTIAGPIRAIDLERDTNTGRIYHLHRAWPCEWESCTGRACTDNARECHQAAPEGGKHAEPVSSGTHRQSVLSRAWLRLVRWLG